MQSRNEVLRRLEDAMDDGGDCVEAWGTAAELREQDGCGGMQSRAPRRGFLRTAVAGVAAPLGLSGVAAAADPAGPEAVERARKKYDGKGLQTIEARGGTILEELVDRGYVPTAELDDLEHDLPEVSGVLVDGTPTAHVHLDVTSDGRQIGINVEPQTGRKYAVVASEDGESAEVIDPAAADSEPSTLCPYIHACDGYGCTCPEYNVACCDSGCYFDGQSGATCSTCSYCGEPHSCSYYCN